MKGKVVPEVGDVVGERSSSTVALADAGVRARAWEEDSRCLEGWWKCRRWLIYAVPLS